MDKVGLAFDALEGVHVLNSDRHFNNGEKESWSKSIENMKKQLQYIENELAIIANGGPSLGSENRLVNGLPNSLYHSIYPFRGTDLYPELLNFGKGNDAIGAYQNIINHSPNYFTDLTAEFRAYGFNSCPPGYYLLVYRKINSKLGFYLNTREGKKVTAIVPRGHVTGTISPSSNIMTDTTYYYPIMGGTNQFSGTWQVTMQDHMMLPRGSSANYTMSYIDVPLQTFTRHSAWGYSGQMLKKCGEIDTYKIVFKDTVHVQVDSVGQLVLPYVLGIANPSKSSMFTDLRLYARLNFPLVIEGEGIKELQPGEHLLSFTARVDINTCVLVCSDKNASISNILVYSHNGVTPVKYHKRRAREYLQINFDLPDDHISAELNTLQVVVFCTITQTSTLVLQSIGEA